MSRSSKDWDYVIVGGGTAGCVLANRLSRDPATRVLLLEAGGADLSPLIHFPAGFYKLGSKYDWWYPAEPDPSLEGKIEYWPAGRVLGGSSSINATTWTRGSPSDFDRWEAAGCRGWGYADVLPYFRKSETYHGRRTDYRGTDGPIHVSPTRVDHPLIDAFVTAAKQQGIGENADFNGARQDGVAYAQVSQRRGLRSSTASAYLRPARFRRNLTTRTGVLATRVVIGGGRARGVEYLWHGLEQQAVAAREVIVSCGSIGSPKLLELSGIGSADRLRGVGVEPVLDQPLVGTNLQDHPVVPFVFQVNVGTLNTELTVRGIASHGARFLLKGGGGATASGSTAVCFLNLDGGRQTDIEINFRPLAVSVGESDPGGPRVERDFSAVRPLGIAAVDSSVWLCHPSSRGSVHLRSANPLAPPVIEHTLVEGDDDARLIREGCHRVREIFAQDALRGYVERELLPGPGVVSDAQFDEFVRRSAGRGHHPVGTCRMGEDGTTSVVDPALRVHGVDGLRVVDASVVPDLISGHTNAATIMIAERAASLVIEASA